MTQERIQALEEALRSTLNFIENTESELGVMLGCGDKARIMAALDVQPLTVQEAVPAGHTSHQIERLIWEAMAWAVKKAPQLFASGISEIPEYEENGNASAEVMVRGVADRIRETFATHQTVTVQDAARVPEIVALIEAAKAANPHISGALGFTLAAALNAIAEGE